MFRRENMSTLMEAIEEYTSLGTGGRIKAGLKLGIYYLIKASVKIVKATSLIKKNEHDARSMDNFLCVFELLKDTIFSDAQYQVNKDRQIRLRKPASLPFEADVRKFRAYTLTKIQKLDVFNFIELNDYISLRNLICARLTLFNARRGGEPPRLFLSELNEGNERAWISSAQLEALDYIDRKLVENTKVTYQSGKGNYS